MLQVGLTGSIAVGKTYVSQLFRDLGCYVLDADEIARKVVSPGSEGLRAVVEAFGEGVLQADGSLDRQKLGNIVFSDKEKRAHLNSLLHPLIIEEQDLILSQLKQGRKTRIAIIDAALMIESGSYRRFDKLIVVFCDPLIQIERLMARNRISKEEAAKRVQAQMSQAEKKSFADYLIDTSRGFEDTHRQVTELYKLLLEEEKKKKD
jgi:dephospho-CoA kinase